jgi:hypothetical protein
MQEIAALGNISDDTLRPRFAAECEKRKNPLRGSDQAQASRKARWQRPCHNGDWLGKQSSSCDNRDQQQVSDAEPEQEILLEPGDRIILYTDGITDVFNSQRRMLGVAGVQRLGGETAALPPDEMKKLILERVEQWRGGEPPTDDLSLILIEV